MCEFEGDASRTSSGDVPVCSGIGALIALSGDRARDMDRIRAYYAAVICAPPEGMGPVRLRDELPRADL